MKTEKHVRDTAAKAYADAMTDEEWLAATLKRLDWTDATLLRYALFYMHPLMTNSHFTWQLARSNLRFE